MKNEADLKLQKAFGKNLAFIRITAGLSQEQLALQAGFSGGYIGDIETGKRNIGYINLFHIAEVLGIEPTKLVDFDK